MLDNLIGNTPMVKIKFKYKGEDGKGIEKDVNVFVKLEYYNLTGSIKDRVALYIIEKAKKEGKLKENKPIVEATSGNTGISLSAIGAYYNNPVYIFMPDWVSKERIQLMKCYGANVKLISKEEGGFIRCVEEAKEFARKNNAFLVNQFSNKDNYNAHYKTTGKEIIEQLEEIEEERENGKEKEKESKESKINKKNKNENENEKREENKISIGGFVSGVGTGGTLMGIGDRLKEKYKDIKIVAIEPEKMPIISEEKGKIEKNNDKENEEKKKKDKYEQHKIEGIGDDFIPELLDKEKIDDIILVSDEEAINMSKKLARELGIGIGISSGANLIGAIKLGYKLEKDIVTVFADDNKKYLSTELGETFRDGEFLSQIVK